MSPPTLSAPTIHPSAQKENVTESSDVDHHPDQEYISSSVRTTVGIVLLAITLSGVAVMALLRFVMDVWVMKILMHCDCDNHTRWCCCHGPAEVIAKLVVLNNYNGWW